jgi:hypothetical protein
LKLFTKLGNRKMKIVFVKPKPGRRVINPDLAPPAILAREGAKVIKSLYWLRRLADGDIELSELNQADAGKTDSGSTDSEAGHRSQQLTAKPLQSKKTQAQEG